MTTTLKRRMPDAYKRVSRMVGLTLLIDDPDAWHGLTVALSARLTMEQRTALAWAALRALPPDLVEDVANVVLEPVMRKDEAA